MNQDEQYIQDQLQGHGIKKTRPVKLYIDRNGNKYIKQNGKFIKIDVKKLKGKLLSKKIQPIKTRRGRTAQSQRFNKKDDLINQTNQLLQQQLKQKEELLKKVNLEYDESVRIIHNKIEEEKQKENQQQVEKLMEQEFELTKIKTGIDQMNNQFDITLNQFVQKESGQLPSEIEKKLTQQIGNQKYKQEYKNLINNIKNQLRQYKIEEQSIEENDFFKKQQIINQKRQILKQQINEGMLKNPQYKNLIFGVNQKEQLQYLQQIDQDLIEGKIDQKQSRQQRKELFNDAKKQLQFDKNPISSIMYMKQLKSVIKNNQQNQNILLQDIDKYPQNIRQKIQLIYYNKKDFDSALDNMKQFQNELIHSQYNVEKKKIKQIEHDKQKQIELDMSEKLKNQEYFYMEKDEQLRGELKQQQEYFDNYVQEMKIQQDLALKDKEQQINQDNNQKIKELEDYHKKLYINDTLEFQNQQQELYKKKFKEQQQQFQNEIIDHENFFQTELRDQAQSYDKMFEQMIQKETEQELLIEKQKITVDKIKNLSKKQFDNKVNTVQMRQKIKKYFDLPKNYQLHELTQQQKDEYYQQEFEPKFIEKEKKKYPELIFYEPQQKQQSHGKKKQQEINIAQIDFSKLQELPPQQLQQDEVEKQQHQNEEQKLEIKPQKKIIKKLPAHVVNFTRAQTMHHFNEYYELLKKNVNEDDDEFEKIQLIKKYWQHGEKLHNEGITFTPNRNMWIGDEKTWNEYTQKKGKFQHTQDAYQSGNPLLYMHFIRYNEDQIYKKYIDEEQQKIIEDSKKKKIAVKQYDDDIYFDQYVGKSKQQLQQDVKKFMDDETIPEIVKKNYNIMMLLAHEQNKIIEVENQGMKGDGQNVLDNGLYNYQINQLMKQKYGKQYIGTFSFSDLKHILYKIMKSKDDQIGFIVNTHENNTNENKQLFHWISIGIDKNKKIIYFYDSLNLNQNQKQFKQFLQQLSEVLDQELYYKLKIVKYKEQRNDSSLCGVFCMLFLDEFFDDDLKDSDFEIINKGFT